MSEANRIELDLFEFVSLKRHGYPCCFGAGFFIFRELWKKNTENIDQISNRAVELTGVRAGEVILKVCKQQDRTYSEFLAIQGARIQELKGIGSVIFNRLRRALLVALEEHAGYKFHSPKERCRMCNSVAQYNSQWRLWDGEKARIAKLPKTGDEIRRERRLKQFEHEINQNYFDF